MQYPGYNNGKVILSEGNWFPFRIHNYVQLQDDAWYFVLQDINGMKHFMPAENYQNYGFRTGDEIICKIDRINCTGRIFLEPKHPYYNEGEIYSFDLVSFQKKGSEIIIIVREIAGKEIEVPLCGNKNLDINGEKKVTCLVKSIIKGIPILEISPDYI
jgi:hypothetical protein